MYAVAAPQGSDGEAGFALIVAIWVSALVALMMLSFAAAARMHLRTTGDAVAEAQTRMLADGGVALAAAELLRAAARGERPSLLEAQRSCRLPDGGLLELSMTDEAAKVDINVAGEDLLTALFVGAGQSLATARRLASAVIDFRDADDERRANGAERDDYRDARHPAVPRNAPFETIGELGQVLGITPALLAALTPHLTVRSGQEGIDGAIADPALIALLGRGAEADGLAARFTAIGGDVSLPESFRVASAAQAFAIRSAVVAPSGTRFVREAVVGLIAAGTAARIDETAAREDPSGTARRSARARQRVQTTPDVKFWEWRRASPTPDKPGPGRPAAAPLPSC